MESGGCDGRFPSAYPPGLWGELDAHDRQVNGDALRSGVRWFSVYRDRIDTRMFVVAEHDRSLTTVMRWLQLWPFGGWRTVEAPFAGKGIGDGEGLTSATGAGGETINIDVDCHGADGDGKGLRGEESTDPERLVFSPSALGNRFQNVLKTQIDGESG